MTDDDVSDQYFKQLMNFFNNADFDNLINYGLSLKEDNLKTHILRVGEFKST